MTRKRPAPGAYGDAELPEIPATFSKKSRKTGSILHPADATTQLDANPEYELNEAASIARNLGPDAASISAGIDQGSNTASNAGVKRTGRRRQTTRGEKKNLLNPPRASKTFFKNQATEERKKTKGVEAELGFEKRSLKAAEEKIAMYEKRIREGREEHWKEAQKEKIPVVDDDVIRSELEDVMDLCKGFAKDWAKTDEFAVDRNTKDIKSLYQMACGQKSTSCCLMDPEYGKSFPQDKGACRMLLEAVLSHHVQHRVFDRPFLLLAKITGIKETKSTSQAEAILVDLFDKMMNENTTVAHLWRAQTIRALCTKNAALSGDTTDYPAIVHQGIACFAKTAMADLGTTVALKLLKNDAGKEQLKSDLLKIYNQAAAMVPRLWIQDVHLKTWGCCVTDFKQSFESLREYLQLHRTRKHSPGDAKFDKLRMHIYTRPALIAHSIRRSVPPKIWVKAIGWRSAEKPLAGVDGGGKTIVDDISGRRSSDAMLKPGRQEETAHKDRIDTKRGLTLATDIQAPVHTSPVSKDESSSSPHTPPLNPEEYASLSVLEVSKSNRSINHRSTTIDGKKDEQHAAARTGPVGKANKAILRADTGKCDVDSTQHARPSNQAISTSTRAPALMRDATKEQRAR